MVVTVVSGRLFLRYDRGLRRNTFGSFTRLGPLPLLLATLHTPPSLHPSGPPTRSVSEGRSNRVWTCGGNDSMSTGEQP